MTINMFTYTAIYKYIRTIEYGRLDNRRMDMFSDWFIFHPRMVVT